MVRLGKERKKNGTFFYKERKRTERSFIKNGKNGTFFYKECKRMQRTEHSFIKNAKERKERNVLLKRTDAQPWVFEDSKNWLLSHFHTPTPLAKDLGASGETFLRELTLNSNFWRGGRWHAQKVYIAKNLLSFLKYRFW